MLLARVSVGREGSQPGREKHRVVQQACMTSMTCGLATAVLPGLADSLLNRPGILYGLRRQILIASRLLAERTQEALLVAFPHLTRSRDAS